MHAALQRFFAAVLVVVLVVLVTGGWMIGRAAKDTVQAGLGFNLPVDWTIMSTLGLVMMAAMILNLLVGAMVGALVPLVAVRLGRDPAVGSSVLLTFTTDSMGFFIFLGLATVFLL